MQKNQWMRSMSLGPLCKFLAALMLGSVPIASAATISFKEGTNVVSSDSAINIPIYVGTEDTSVNAWGGAANLSYGANIDLHLGESSLNDDFHVLIRFDVSALANKYSAINAVALQLHHYAHLTPTDDRRVDIYAIDTADADWVEGTGSVPWGTLAWRRQLQRKTVRHGDRVERKRYACTIGIRAWYDARLRKYGAQSRLAQPDDTDQYVGTARPERRLEVEVHRSSDSLPFHRLWLPREPNND